MGCDIHLFAEKRVNGKWESIDQWTKNPDFDENDNEFGEPEFIINREDYFYTGGRNYNLFCALAGARSFQFYGTPNIVAEPRGIPDDCCEEIKRESGRMDTDGHTHSYLYLPELEQFEWTEYGTTCNAFISEVIPKMKGLGLGPEDVRIVFFFDN